MDGLIIGAVSFFGMAILIVVVRTYSQTVRLERTVGQIAIKLGIDVNQPPVMSDRVKEIARDPDRKIEAIKAYREETGAGLAEAKTAVEQYQRSLS